MKKFQTGFTIVELMIVVAVIGVLASIAMPIYSDYVNRGKVSEAVQLLGGLRIPMQEFYMARGTWPTIQEVGGKSSGSYVEKIESSSEPDNLYIEATLRGQSGSSVLGGKQLRMVFFQQSRTWNWLCTTDDTTNPIDDRLLPSSCKPDTQ